MLIGNFTRWNNDWITVAQLIKFWFCYYLIYSTQLLTFWVKIPSYHTGYDDSGDGLTKYSI